MGRGQYEIVYPLPSVTALLRQARNMAQHVLWVEAPQRGQVNENCKGWAYFEVLPELDHNALAGVHNPAQAARWIRALFLHASQPSAVSSRTDRRIELTRQLFERYGIACRDVPVPGESALAQILAAVQLGDYVSCYLAFLYGANPTELDDVVWFKQQMAQG